MSSLFKFGVFPQPVRKGGRGRGNNRGMRPGSRLMPVRPRQDGFTLLEVVIALAILSGVIAAVITTINYHIGAADRLSSMTTAVVLAREKIEDINMNGLPSVNEGRFEAGNEGFRWTIRTEDLAFQDMKKIYLTVSWERGDKILIETYKRGK